MGSAARAYLVYGFDLGTDEDFKAAERGEYDEPILPWLPGDDGNDDEVEGFADAALRVLLASVGFTEEWSADSEGYFDRKRAAEQQIGVEFDFSGSGDYPGYVLLASGSSRSVEWAETMSLDAAALAAPRPEWDAKLAAALAALGIHPTQDRPRWLVYPCYG